MIKKIIYLLIFTFTATFLNAQFRTKSLSERKVLLEIENTDYELKRNGEDIVEIIAEGSLNESIAGNPILPYFGDVLVVPENGGAEFKVVSFDKKIYENAVLENYKDFELEDGLPVYFDTKKSRNENKWFPDKLVEKGSEFCQGTNRFTGIKVFPFKYSPYLKKLIVYENIVIDIDIKGKIDRKNKNIPVSSLAKAALNYEYADMYSFAPKPYAENIRKRESVYPSFQFVVDKEGIYKLTYEELNDSVTVFKDSLNFATGFDLNTIDPRFFHLRSEAGEIPVYIKGEKDGHFDEGDYLEFYGDRHYGDFGYSDDYTAENVYTLTYEDTHGARMAIENGGLVISDNTQFTVPEAFEQTVHFEEQNSFNRLGFLNPSAREDLFFWREIDAPDMRFIPVNLQYPYGSNQHDFFVKACLMGISHARDLPSDQPDHHAYIRFNAKFIDEHYWFRRSEQIFENEEGLPNSFLQNGENKLYISLPGDVPGLDIVALDYFDVKYWQEYKTDEDFLKFTKPSDEEPGLFQFELQNFSSDSVSVYKIGTSKFENMQVESFSQNGTAPFTVTFQDRVFDQNTEYICVTESKKLSPKLIRPDYESRLKSTDNYANAVIITSRDFIESEGTLLFKELWENNCSMPDGSPVVTQIVDVQNIYDEFNFGIKSADAIKEFLKYAYFNWGNGATGTQANYVLLLGDGIADERDNSSSRKFNIIPTKMIFQYKYGASPSDNWYGCIVGDDKVADINIARICVWEEDQILPIAEKSQYYMENPNYNDLWHHNVTLAAGGKASDANDIFAQQSERLRKIIPERYNVSRVYTNTSTVSPDYLGGTFTLKDDMDDGVLFVQFMGHGGGQIWADYNLLNFNDIETLTNENYPFVVSLCCYASAFDSPGSRSMSEAFIDTPERGAIAHLGFSGLGYLYEDENFSRKLLEAMFEKKISNVSEIITYAKAKFYAVSGGHAGHAITTGACLTGDPLINFYYPQKTASITIDNYTPEQGDTIRIQADFPAEALGAEFIVQDENEIEMNIPYVLPVINGSAVLNYKVKESSEQVYNRKIKSYAYSDSGEYSASTTVAVGQSAVFDVKTEPEYPAANDSVLILAGCFDKEGISEFNLILNYITVNDTNIIAMNSIGDNHFEASFKIPPFDAGANIYFKFGVVNAAGDYYETKDYVYYVEGPDLVLSEYEIITENQHPKMDVLIENTGNTSSPASEIRFNSVGGVNEFGRLSRILRDSVSFVTAVPEIPANESVHVYFDFPIYSGKQLFQMTVNPENVFSETNTANNSAFFQHEMNMAYVGPGKTEIESLDGFCRIDFSGFTERDSLLVSLEKAEFKVPINQESAVRVLMPDSTYSETYRIGIHEPGLADSSGCLSGNKTVTFNIKYDVADSINLENNMNADPFIYRWNGEYEKWIKKGGILNVQDSSVTEYLNRIGEFTLLFNNDDFAPSIDVNIEDQEFTKESYVSKDGIISFVLSDANGINVSDKEINLFLSGVPVPDEDYVVTALKGHLNQVPIKYQIDLEDGVYDITAECTDVNGNYAEKTVEIKVNSKFDISNVANYPNPVRSIAVEAKNEGRTRFTYVLSDDADYVSLKVYTVSGRLVKEFKNLPTAIGYHEFPRTVLGWDCRDQNNVFLANGVYFYRLTAKKGGKKIEKIRKMAILK